MAACQAHSFVKVDVILDNTNRPAYHRNFTATFMVESIDVFGHEESMNLATNCTVQVIQEDIDSLKNDIPFLTLFSDDIGCRDVDHLYDIARRCHSSLTLRLTRGGGSIFFQIDTLSDRVPNGILWDPERSAYLFDFERFTSEFSPVCKVGPSPYQGLQSTNEIGDNLTLAERGPFLTGLFGHFGLSMDDLGRDGRYEHLLPRSR